MPVMPPEIREDRGEIEAALAGKLPHLVEPTDIRGDLHCHTRRSDGNESAEHMARAAMARGYEYLAITDHTRTAAYARGLSIDQLKASMAEIDELNEEVAQWPSDQGSVERRATSVERSRRSPLVTRHSSLAAPFRILKGAEVDILLDGKLDYPDRVLAELDIVVASIHQAFKRNVTERICDALANPHVDVIAHPSGRLISRREGYEVDLDKVLECARRYRKVLELNSYPDRLDLNDIWVRKAKELGIRIAINTDAHAIGDLNWIRYGIATARRGWLEKIDVLNCLGLNELLKVLAHGK
jgi:DNA polymerase (family 10)